MKDTKEFVLFFKEEAKYSSIDVAKEIMNRYELIGEPVLLPDNGDAKLPTIIFNKNADMQVQVSKISVNVIVNHTYFNALSSIVFDMVDIFESFDLSFYRIGYISSVFLAPKYVSKVKERFLKIDNLEGMEDFNFSWYHAILNKNGKINCWERIITDKANFSDLLMQYDFNSPVNEEIELNMKYIKEFINSTNDYIEERVNF